MPDRYHVIIMPRAELDLDAIHDFIAKDSPSNAKRFISFVIHSIYDLQTMPNRYRAYRRTRGSKAVIRRMPVGLYLVYYTVDDKQLRVEVITVRHGMRRQPRNITRG